MAGSLLLSTRLHFRLSYWNHRFQWQSRRVQKDWSWSMFQYLYSSSLYIRLSLVPAIPTSPIWLGLRLHARTEVSETWPSQFSLTSTRTSPVASEFSMRYCLVRVIWHRHSVQAAGLAYRGLFVIDPSGVVRHVTCNDLPVGRSVDETLRVLKAFQYVDKHGEVCPADWKDDDSPTIKPGVQSSKEYFNKVNK